MAIQQTGTLFLTGFMGCGKSYWGSRWATVLNCPFIELDAAIEKAAGQKITQIFELSGETFFRELEALVLRQQVNTITQIVSAGGGTPCFLNNMNWMNANGTTVYLKASPALLAERLQHETEQRPLVTGLSGAALRNFITKKLAERERFYEQAAVTLDVATLTDDSLATQLA